MATHGLILVDDAGILDGHFPPCKVDQFSLRLPVCVVAGAVTFTVALVGLWLAAGRPPSVEADALRWCLGALRAWQARRAR